MNNQHNIAPVIILGMHRSGTSCLAGSLQEAGLYLGDVNERAPYNRNGNRENRAIMDLNDAVLSANDGSWDRLADTVVWNVEHRARRDELIRTYPTNRTWGFKDPRTLLTLEGWLEGLPSARFVGTYRHPMAVAMSLCTRNGFSIPQSLSLWMNYNRLLLKYQRQFDFGLVCFDLPPGEYHENLVRVAARLDLTEPKRGFSFFKSKFRKNQASTANVGIPASVIVMYRTLQEIAS